MKPWHMLVCAGVAVAALVVVATGGSALVIVPALGCALMMGMMIWMMVRAGGHGHGGG